MTRFFDIILSTLAIILLSPIFVIVMLILKITGEHYIFYLQRRVGKGKKQFSVLKFATMLKDSPNMKGGYLTQKKDPRVLPVGRILRATKINELPQLFNIWIGQMSVVGPRPQAPIHFNLYSREQKDAISAQRPGLTGIGSLIFRDEEGLLERSGMDYDYFHDEVITPYKGELEKWFSQNKSVFLYFKLIVLTAVSVIRPGKKFFSSFKSLPKLPKELEKLF